MDVDNFPAGLRVLAVDDDRVCLKILQRQLEYCNYNVTVVTDARTALDMLKEGKDGNQFDLVISDVVMPNMDGFKLLELIGLEMDLPVIMLSANNETQTIVKGIKHGACDYIVKPVRLEQLRGIWTHVVKNIKTCQQNSINSDTDDVVQKLPSGDDDKGEKVVPNHRKNSKKNKRFVDVVDEENENTPAQKKQRVQWCGQLHRKFIEAVRQIGFDRAVPKKILEIMNVEGITREQVASHLQKYRIYLRKLGEGSLGNSNPFANETDALRRNMNIASFIDLPSSSNHFSKLNSSFAVGTQTLLPTQSVQVISSQKNMGIPRSDMEPVGHGVNLPKDGMPMPVQDISRFISSGKYNAPVSSGGLPGASQRYPSSPSGISFGIISNDVVLNAGKHSSVDISGRSVANRSNDYRPTLTSNMCIPSSFSCRSYASILCSKILGSSRGTPFEDIANGEMKAPGYLPLQSPELVDKTSVQFQSCSAGQFNKFSRDVHQYAGLNNSWKTVVPSRFSDLSHNVGRPEGPTQANIFKINQLSRLASSSGQIPTFGNEYQKKVTGIVRKVVPEVGFGEQVAPFSFGNGTQSTLTPIGNSVVASSSKNRSDLEIDNSASASSFGTRPNLQIDNSAIHEGSTINQQAVGDQVNNINELAQNAESGNLDDFLDYLVNQDFVNSGDSFIDGDSEFAP